MAKWWYIKFLPGGGMVHNGLGIFHMSNHGWEMIE